MKTTGKVLAGVCAAALMFVAGVIYAQDVVQVAGDSHTVLLENDQVRVLKVDVKPGQKVPMHSHPHNVAYFLTDGKVKVIWPDGKTEERNIKAGTSSWSEATTHAAENIGMSDFQEIQIELKK
jgi:quercetin dioxygenase-like cupin family protein